MAVVDMREPRTRSPEERVVDGALRCFARWGVGKTTLDDIAAAAGCSRATVYRLFPGGKERVLQAVVRHEVARFFAGLATRLAGIDDLEDLLVAGIAYTGRELSDHAALQFLLAYEPELILPRISFRHMDHVLALVSDAVAPFLAPHVGTDEAPRVAEWLVRVVVSYTLAPSTAFDVRDEASVRRLVRAFVLPGLVQPVTA